ncbi:MAG: hypothetical protein ACRDZM_11350 [Acidimicrobiia bacterium]
MEDTATQRHPFRFLFKLLLFAGGLTAITRFVASKKKEYYGLTESEARAKFESKLAPRIGEEKATEVADQVIPRLKDSGVIKPDPMEQAVDEAKHAASDAADEMKDAAEKAGDSVKDAIGKIEKELD